MTEFGPDRPRGYSDITLDLEAYEEFIDIYARWIVARLTLLVLRDEKRMVGPLTTARRTYREQMIAFAEVELAVSEAELTRLQLGGRR